MAAAAARQTASRLLRVSRKDLQVQASAGQAQQPTAGSSMQGIELAVMFALMQQGQFADALTLLSQQASALSAFWST